MARPTIERLRAILDYDAETGRLLWKIKRGRMPSGSTAGCIQTFPISKSRSTKSQYWVVRVDRVLLLSHRVVWAMENGSWPDRIDHKDGDSLNNRTRNLRPATQRQNMQNAKKRIDNRSGFKGVSWDPINKKWVARIRSPKGLYENLGRFVDPIIASDAYQRRAVELFGQFARF